MVAELSKLWNHVILRKDCTLPHQVVRLTVGRVLRKTGISRTTKTLIKCLLRVDEYGHGNTHLRLEDNFWKTILPLTTWVPGLKTLVRFGQR